MSGSGKKLFGMVSVGLDHPYQALIWRGVTQRAAELDIGIVAFLGSYLEKADHPSEGENVAYAFANRGNVDGLIVITSVLGCGLGEADIKRSFAVDAAFPVVSVGIPVPGMSNVWLQPDQEIRRLVDHLVETHRRRKFVIVTGPAAHEESAMRKAAYLAALARHRIGIGEERTYTGGFDAESGSLAVKKFFEAGIDFDAVVCLNDCMALGAIAELLNVGSRVPADVSVVGFDGIEDGIYAPSPLTTIGQPLVDLGRTALDEILRRSERGGSRDIKLPCELIVRQSCGCKEKYGSLIAAPPDAVSGIPPEDRMTVEFLIGQLMDTERGEFLDLFDEIINARIGIGMDIQVWTDYLFYIRAFAASRAEKPERAARYQSLVLCALDSLGKINGRALVSRRLSHEKHTEIIRTIGQSLAQVFEFPSLLSKLDDGLKLLGFEFAWLVVFHCYGDTGAWRQYQLDAAGPHELDAPLPSSPFPPLPRERGFFDGDAWILIPLVFQNEPIGYLLLSGEQEDCAVYGLLGKQLSSSLKGALLWDEVLRHERILESEVEKRTSDLVTTNAKLKKEIVRRIQLEREVIDASNHTMQRIGRDLHDDMCQYLASISMRVSALQQSLMEERPKEVQTLGTINKLLTTSMDRLKGIVKGLVPQSLAESGLAAALADLLDSLKRTYTRVSMTYTSSGTLDYLDNARAALLYRIVQEALSNALKHSGCHTIELAFVVHSAPRRAGAKQRLTIEVRDDGVGLKRSSLSRGLGLKIMRYRAEKAGARLTIRNTYPGVTVACVLDIPDRRNGGFEAAKRQSRPVGETADGA